MQFPLSTIFHANRIQRQLRLIEVQADIALLDRPSNDITNYDQVKVELLKTLFADQQFTLIPIHDCEYEIDKDDMKEKLKTVFEIMEKRHRKRGWLCRFGIWTVMLINGDNTMIEGTSPTFDTEPTLSDAIINGITSGTKEIDVYGAATSPKEAFRLLKDDDFFQND